MSPFVASVLPDGRVALNGGRDRGFAVGQVFDVRERGAPVTDPATGDVLGVLEGKRLGSLRVSEVQDRILADIIREWDPLGGRGITAAANNVKFGLKPIRRGSTPMDLTHSW